MAKVAKSATLKVGMIGGGLESFMGEIHREAIKRTGCLELVCGAFGTTRQRSFDTGRALGLDPRRVYGIYRDMFRRERSLPVGERIDFVTVVAPNNMHYPVSMAAFDSGFPVFAEKPLSCNMDEAMNLKRKSMMNEGVHTSAYVYPFYPAIIAMKKFVEKGGIGVIRRVNVSYFDGWLGVRQETAGNRSAGWRVDPRRAGLAGALVDLAGQCAFVAEHISGLNISEVAADAHIAIAGRSLDDDASVMVHFDNGAIGTFEVSQITLGEADGISIALFGDKGTIKWRQSEADTWTFINADGESKVTKQARATASTIAPNRFKTPYGHEEAYIDALALAYREFASLVFCEKTKRKLSNRSVTIDQALRVSAFNDAVVHNIAPQPPDTPQQKWTPVVVPEVHLLT